MKSRMTAFARVAAWSAAVGVLAFSGGLQARAQAGPSERTFPQSKAAVEKALTVMQASLAGHLPVLEGFAKPGEHPLDRYQRGYYQATVQVTPTASGGSVVRVTTKVTAWYTDPAASRSGYQLLLSNGRLEGDLLDQLAEQLAKSSPGTAGTAPVPAPNQSATVPTGAAPPPAPSSKSPDTSRPFSSSASQSLAAQERESMRAPSQRTAEKSTSPLQAEAKNLEEILKNQAHPKNLVAVKKSGTPVVNTPSLSAKPQFLASMHDEFELLDFNADWVHVRISGLSRGWIWRNSVEMPEGIPDTSASTSTLAPAADLFHVIREETAPFPGDWAPLRGKSVKIISVQKIEDSAKEAGPKERIEYAKYLFEKNYKELAQKTQEQAGIVVIFDSADGGMIAATMSTLQQWKAGTLSDAALWHQCFFDPPETFDSAGSGASQ